MKEKDLKNPFVRYRRFLFLFVIVLLAVILWISDWDNIEHATAEMLTASIPSILILILMFALHLVFDALILQVAMEDKHLTFRKSIEINLAGAFFSGATPFYIGSYPSRLYYMYKEGLPFDKGLAALTVKGITYQLIIVIVGFLGLLTEGGRMFAGGYLILVIIGFVWNIATVTILVLISASIKANQIAVALIQKLAHTFRFFANRQDEFIDSITNYYGNTRRIYTDFKYFFRVFWYSLLKVAVFYAMPIAVFYGLGMPIKEYWLDILAISTLMAIIVSVFPTPGGMAASEAVFIVAYGFLYSSQSSLEASMLIFRMFSYYFVILIGFFATLVLQARPTKVIKED